MNRPSLAILERAVLGHSRASEFAAEHGCFFCDAREHGGVADGDIVVVLNGSDTGATFRVERITEQAELVGVPLPEFQQTDRGQRRLNLPFELCGKLPLSPPPAWFPPMTIRNTFIVDELATWFCSRGMETGNFVWSDFDMDEIIRVIWQKRLPIKRDELVTYFAAHGLRSQYHAVFGDRYEHGMRLLIAALGRSPIKKLRLDSFDNIDQNPRTWFDSFVLPGLGKPESQS